MRKISLFFLVLAAVISTRAIDFKSVKPIKNVIILIPDGCSFGTVSAARWLQYYADPNNPKLNIDAWLCGTVRTNNSDAPIGDSAPTTSCYMTGHPSRAGYVSTYPPSRGKDNIEPIDSTRAYAPAATILEAAKQVKGKSTGLVFTCEFPHATPADCSSHYYNRGAYNLIAPQIVHNNVDVVIGGGNAYLDEANETYLKNQGYSIYRDDIEGMRQDKSPKMWSLYGRADMDYDLDRNPQEQPSLAEMTKIAIEKLSKNKQGFFLMVEGSKVDWAAHANDPAAMTSEFLAFDKACGVALDFALKDGNTVVIAVPDHGNSGFSIGRRDLGDYGHASKDKLFLQASKYKLTADGLEAKMNTQPFDSLKSIFKTYTDIDLTKEEINLLMNAKGYKNSPIPEEFRSPDKNSPLYSSYLSGVITKILTAHTYFGFTSGGHTGEEVFLACYHPQPSQRLMGMNTNRELAHYLQALNGMYGKMQEFSDQIFATHKEVFKGYNLLINKADNKKEQPVLIATNLKNGKQLTIRPFTNQIELSADGHTETIQLPSVITYVDRNDMFYLPKDIVKYLK